MRTLTRLHRLALTALSASLVAATPARFVFAETVDHILVIVNDEEITQSDMNKFAARLQTGGLTDDLLVPNEAVKQELLKDREKLLKKMVDAKIIDSEIKKQNLSVGIERVEQEIRNIAKRNNVSRDDLKNALQEQGIPFSQYQDFIKTGLERQALIEKVITSRIKISEDDVNAALAAKNGSAAGQAFEYTLAHIYFSEEKGGLEAARGRAQTALDKLKGGADFEKLASEINESPTAEAGGLLGVFKTGEMQKELDQTVQKLSAGEFTSVLPTSGGFQIVRVLKKRAISDPRTDKEREPVRAQLYQEAYLRQVQSWLDQLRQEAFIHTNAL